MVVFQKIKGLQDNIEEISHKIEVKLQQWKIWEKNKGNRSF